MSQQASTLIRFENPAAVTRQARALMMLESYSELLKLVESDEALLGGYEADDGTLLLAWINSSDMFERLRTYSKSVRGYYALTRELAVEFAPELANIPDFLPRRSEDNPPSRKRAAKKARAKGEENAPVQQVQVEEAATSVDVIWDRLEAQLEMFHAVTAALKSAGVNAGVSRPIDPGLLLLTIAEQGRTTGEAMWAADFLIREMQGNGSDRYQKTRSGYFNSGGYPAEARDSLRPTVTAALFEILQTASDIAQATTDAPVIHTRQLVAALLRAPLEESVDALLTDLGLDAEVICERMLGFVVGGGDDDPEWARELSREAPEKRLVAFTADDPKGEDLIGISREVVALATLIAARDIRPPLSVGLFGDWGSGKTFFMRQLRTAISSLSKEARDSGQMQKDLHFYKRIVQIEFNAWHYVEGNLWASLVEHIFSNLKIDEDDHDTVTYALQRDLLAKIGFRQAAVAAATEQEQQAAAAVQAAENQLRDTERRRDEKRQELTELKAVNIKRLFDLPAIQEKLQPLLAALGLDAVSTAATDIDHALKRAHAVLQQGGGVFSPLFHARDRGLRWAKLAAAVLVPSLIGLTVTWLVRTVNFAPIASVFSTLAALGATLTRWLNRQTQWVNEKMRRVQSIQQDYDNELREALQKNDEEVTQLQQELRDLSAERDIKLQHQLEAQKALETVQNELQSATSARLLADFIVDRAESTDYRKHLGLLALVRDDFEKLSGLIDDENWKLAPALKDEKVRTGLAKFKTVEDENREAGSRINRIVLYIDDLDRCPPNKVVEVLQAVHLLLAFPLFVVVVGVDARWVKRSLRSRYKELLHSSVQRDEDEEELELIGRATADDYLEKIFQVPFWLEPMDVTGCRRMVTGLLRASLHSNGASADRSEQQQGSASDAQQSVDAAKQNAPVTMRSDANVAKPESDSSNEPAASDSVPPPPPPNVESLEIMRNELQFMNELAPVLGRSPRALKRFVNVYRLLKAELTKAELHAFLDPKYGAYRVALFLLAVDTGTPLALAGVYSAVAQQREQHREHPGEDAGWLISTLEMAGVADGGSRFDAERLRLRDWISERRFEPYLANADIMGRWAERIARYSFGAHALELLRTPPVQLAAFAEIED